MFQLGKVLVFLALFAVFSFAQGSTGPVPYHGRMKAVGNKLVGEISGSPVQVRGMSFYWSCPTWAQSTDKLWSAATVDAMVDGWKVEILRAAMAANADNGCGGDYQSNQTATINRVKTVVDRAIARDIYVIIDWHSHKAHNQQDSVIAFFVNKMAQYHNVPNVIFEIYNEPEVIAWNPNLKTFSQAVVNAIRAKANNLILIGTTHADQNPDVAAKDPVTGEDLAYVLHFYAASHKLGSPGTIVWGGSKNFQSVAQDALNANKPLFVSEWGTVSSNGGGSPDINSSNAWHDFMDQHKISSCMWQISNLAEGSSIFTSSFNIPSNGSDAGWTNQNNMSANGKYIYEKFASYAQSADWRNSQPPSSSSLGNSGSSSSGGGTNPITISKIANGPVRVHAISNAIVLENLPNNAKVQIYNLCGKLVYSQFSTLNSQLIPIQTKGLYIAKVNKKVFYVTVK